MKWLNPWYGIWSFIPESQNNDKSCFNPMTWNVSVLRWMLLLLSVTQWHSVTLRVTLRGDISSKSSLLILWWLLSTVKRQFKKWFFPVIANCRKLSVSQRGHLQTSPQMAQTQRVAWSCFSAFWELVDFYVRLVREGWDFGGSPGRQQRRALTKIFEMHENFKKIP